MVVRSIIVNCIRRRDAEKPKYIEIGNNSFPDFVDELGKWPFDYLSIAPPDVFNHKT